MAASTVLWTLAAVLVAALIVAWVAGMMRAASREYDRLWGPLASRVDGSWRMAKLRGSYDGYPLRAYVSGGQQGDLPIYEYNLLMSVPPHGEDWMATYGSYPPTGWSIESPDQRVKERLIQAGLLFRLETNPDFPTVSYDARRGELLYQQRMAGVFDLPDPDTFQRQLDFMVSVAELSRRAELEVEGS